MPNKDAPMKALNIAVVTLSDSRDETTDTSGKYLADSLQQAGHQLIGKKILPDCKYHLRALVSNWVLDKDTEVIIANEQDIAPTMMAGTDGKWGTTRFVDPNDLRHDMHVTIVTFEPGGVIPFLETHVMEHGLYVLEGKAAYRLNSDWVEVEAGDYMWLRAFCPQACYAGGPGPFRYLLYKDVNRHMPLRPTSI